GRILVQTDGRTGEIVEKLRTVWNKTFVDVPFEFTYLADTYSNLYEKDKKQAYLVIIGCFVSITITLFGLLGLAFFGAHRRLKEIAIRRVYGATTSAILNMSIRQSSLWTIAGALLAIPIATYLAKIWISNFAYRTQLPVADYALIVLVALLVTSVSVLYQTSVVVMKNPSEVLRHD
ncbi:MAG TPA: FtsX-like permease family protein, partial [Cyclobacteriaceae bacterium]|nr:FtsX-like permease family protein [Cyclobacteriaceae bacterium]